VQDAGVRARADVVDDRARIVIDAVDQQGRFQNNLDFEGILVTPDNQEVKLKVVQSGPGRYEAAFDAPESGTHYLSLRYKDAKGRSVLYTHGMVVPYSAEYRELSTNLPLLASLAKATEGRVLQQDDDVFARTFEPAPRYADAWPYLLLLAILLVPFDVLVRRVFLDYAAIGRWFASTFVLRRKPAARAAHMSALLSAKQETREELARRTKKFEGVEPAEMDKVELTPGGDIAKPEVKIAERPDMRSETPAVAREGQTYMGRLLRAKRKAREDDRKKQADNSSGSDTEK